VCVCVCVCVCGEVVQCAMGQRSFPWEYRKDLDLLGDENWDFQIALARDTKGRGFDSWLFRSTFR